MATIHVHRTTTLTPEQFIAGLTDFGPGRSELFPNSADGYLEVHDQGPGQADVTEGSRGIWERLHYDWSDPSRVVLTTTDSNVWGRNSGHTYTFTESPDGTTDIDVVVVREGKNFKGRALEIAVGLIGKPMLGKQLGKTVKAIEARNERPRPAEPT
jgi:hypothetical protein